MLDNSGAPSVLWRVPQAGIDYHTPLVTHATGGMYLRIPEQVTAWNAGRGAQRNMIIDPETRTATNYIFVTGKTPKLTLPSFWRALNGNVNNK